MCTPVARRQLAREDIPYATSLPDVEWSLVAPFLPAPASTGRPRLWSMRLVLDGILYMLRTGSA